MIGGLAAIVIFALLKLNSNGVNVHGFAFRKNLADRGPDDYFTLDSLKGVIGNMLTKDGIEYKNLDVYHEVGNRFAGSYVDEYGDCVNIVIYTDGYETNYDFVE